MRETACSKLQSSVVCSSENNSVVSLITSAGLSTCRTSMPRESISRPRWRSASLSRLVRSSRSLASCTRPLPRRTTCWPMMPARRARSISSRSRRRPARSILPVAASVVTRSSADDSVAATSLPSCATSACGSRGSAMRSPAAGALVRSDRSMFFNSSLRAPQGAASVVLPSSRPVCAGTGPRQRSRSLATSAPDIYPTSKGLGKKGFTFRPLHSRRAQRR